MPENQTAWNYDNNGIKEKINQKDQTFKVADNKGRLRKTLVKWQTVGAGWLPNFRGAAGRG